MSTTTPSTEAARVDALSVPSRAIPLLSNGDHLTGDEFERRYDAMPHLKKAELIDGVVYIPSPDFYTSEGTPPTLSSPVSFRGHAIPHYKLISWLGHYSALVRGVEGGDNGSLRLDKRNRPHPDGFLIILPEYGGQARISDDDYLVGAPELVAEVAYSSVSLDMHAKLDVYRRNGAREYLVWRVEDRAIDWFVLREGRYDRLMPTAEGIVRSEVFPGLWLDSEALVRLDMPAVFRAVEQGLASAEHAAFVAGLRERPRP